MRRHDWPWRAGRRRKLFVPTGHVEPAARNRGVAALNPILYPAADGRAERRDVDETSAASGNGGAGGIGLDRIEAAAADRGMACSSLDQVGESARDGARLGVGADRVAAPAGNCGPVRRWSESC